MNEGDVYFKLLQIKYACQFCIAKGMFFSIQVKVNKISFFCRVQKAEEKLLALPFRIFEAFNKCELQK